MRKLTFIGAGTSDYHDIIASAGYEKPVAFEYLRCLETDIVWHFADLNQLREGGLLRTFVDLKASSVFAIAEVMQEECPYLPLPNDGEEIDRWDILLAEYSKKMRANVRYYNRALDRIYTVERRIATTKEEVKEGLSALFQLHQRRWNQRWLPGVFYSARVRGFHRMAATGLLDQGHLRLHFLILDNSIEAVLYCFSINNITSYYQGGFEPSLSKLSLGSVVTGLAIQQATLENCSKFDFLRGDEPYKTRWTRGKSAWNSRWLMARRGFILFQAAVLVARIELRIEQRFKQWMHHRRSPKIVETVEKDVN